MRGHVFAGIERRRMLGRCCVLHSRTESRSWTHTKCSLVRESVHDADDHHDDDDDDDDDDDEDDDDDADDDDDDDDE